MNNKDPRINNNDVREKKIVEKQRELRIGGAISSATAVAAATIGAVTGSTVAATIALPVSVALAGVAAGMFIQSKSQNISNQLDAEEAKE